MPLPHKTRRAVQRHLLDENRGNGSALSLVFGPTSARAFRLAAGAIGEPTVWCRRAVVCSPSTGFLSIKYQFTKTKDVMVTSARRSRREKAIESSRRRQVASRVANFLSATLKPPDNSTGSVASLKEMWRYGWRLWNRMDKNEAMKQQLLRPYC
jgi:hypothetical protein